MRTRSELSAEAVRDLSTLLRGYGTARVVSNHIASAIEAYKQALGHEAAGAIQDRRIRVRLEKLLKEINVLSGLVTSFNGEDGHTLMTFNSDARLELLGALRQAADSAQVDADLRKGKPGRKSLPRLSLNVAVASALKSMGVPLSKGRDSLVAQVYAIIYADLGLSKGDDPFDAFHQGVTLIKRGVRISHKKRVR